MVMGFEKEDPGSYFLPGSGIMIETAEGGMDVGDLVGASMFGIVFRSTHRMVTRTLSDEEVNEFLDDKLAESLREEGAAVTKTELEPLTHSVLTLLPWSEVKRVELSEEYLSETQVRDFREALETEDGIESELGLDETIDILGDEDDDDDDK